MIQGKQLYGYRPREEHLRVDVGGHADVLPTCAWKEWDFQGASHLLSTDMMPTCTCVAPSPCRSTVRQARVCVSLPLPRLASVCYTMVPCQTPVPSPFVHSDAMCQLADTLQVVICNQQQTLSQPQQGAPCGPGAVPSSSLPDGSLPLPLLQLAACVLEAGCQLAQHPQGDLAPFTRLAAAVALSPAVTALLPSLMYDPQVAVPDSNTPCWLPYGGGPCSPGLLALRALYAAVAIEAFCVPISQAATCRKDPVPHVRASRDGERQRDQQPARAASAAGKPYAALVDVLLRAVAPLPRLPEREGGAWALQLLLVAGTLMEERKGAGGAGSGGLLARAVAAEAGSCPGLWWGVLPAASALLQQLAAPGKATPGLGQATLADGSGGPSDRCCLSALRRRAPAATVQLLHACAALLTGVAGEGEAAQAALLDPALAPGVVEAALRVLQGTKGHTGAQLLVAALALLQPLAPQVPRKQAAALLAALADLTGSGGTAASDTAAGAVQVDRRVQAEHRGSGVAVPPPTHIGTVLRCAWTTPP